VPISGAEQELKRITAVLILPMCSAPSPRTEVTYSAGCLISVLFCFFPLLAAETSNKKVVSHEAVLGGKLAAKTSFTLNRSGSLRAEDLTGKTPLLRGCDP